MSGFVNSLQKLVVGQFGEIINKKIRGSINKYETPNF